jgi:hypothetical protein
MRLTRRQMLAAGGAMAAVLAESRVNRLRGQVRAPTPQPMPSPNAPRNENAPLGMDTDIPVRNGDRQLAPAAWLDIKSDAQKILDLATDFKWQVDRANLNNTLPLLLVHQAHDIEKLAKQVQGRMKS